MEAPYFIANSSLTILQILDRNILFLEPLGPINFQSKLCRRLLHFATFWPELLGGASSVPGFSGGRLEEVKRIFGDFQVFQGILVNFDDF